MIAVAAGIVSRNGKIMLCRRKPGGPQSLKWEFPGGKLEPGESGEQALERELREELGIETRTCRIYDVRRSYAPDRDILLLFYHSELTGGEPEAIDCTAVAWVEPAHLADYDLAPTDALVAARLAQDLR